MVKDSKQMRWLAGAAAAACGSLLLLIVSCTGGNSLRARHLSAREAAELTNTIATANQTAEAALAEQANAWRARFESARSPQQLKAFVERLISLEQKIYQGVEMLQGQGDEQRVRALFRQYVLDDRQLGADMQSTIEGFEQFLFEQDRPILEAAGVSAEDWSRSLQAVRPAMPNWSAVLEPVVAQAVREARDDLGRSAMNEVVSDYTGNGLKSLARSTGLDNTQPGSFGDMVTGVAMDAAAGFFVDAVLDPTDSIVASLRHRMIAAEQSLLDGEQGLVTVLQQTKAAHEAARNSLIGITPAR